MRQNARLMSFIESFKYLATSKSTNQIVTRNRYIVVMFYNFQEEATEISLMVVILHMFRYNI